jgi:hypothetical protein
MKATLRFFCLFVVLAGCSSHGWDGGNPDASSDSQLTPPAFEAGISEGGCSVAHCSQDLHQVIDCNGNVLKTCSPDEACGAGGNCVSACQGAIDNQSAVGCDFYAVTPAPDSTAADSCYAVLLANTWTAPIDVTVTYAGTQLSGGIGYQVLPDGSLTTLTNNQLLPNQVGAYFLSAKNSNRAFWTNCPGTAGITQSFTAVDDTGIGHAFHVSTSAPVVAYDVYPYGGAKSYITSASLLVPTSAWGTNYIGADGYARTAGAGSPYMQIVASEDATSVTILPSQAIVGGTNVAPANQNQPATYTLDKGDYIQFFQNAELAGSPIASDKPISVFGGASCADVPVQTAYCDSLHQQLVPVSMLGHSYVATRYRNRSNKEETVPWRFVGAVNGTTLTYDPPQSGAPTTLSKGQLVEFSAPGPFVVSSQDDAHPFYMSAHMVGAYNYPTPNWDGDPDYVNIIPPDRWLASYLFLSDPTYKSTNLVFVRRKASDGTFKDVTLDCAGTLTGWQSIGGGGDYEYTRADLIIGGAPQGKCTNGVHQASSTEPFALTVWGFDNSVSYAYPAGMGTSPINSVIVPPTPN